MTVKEINDILLNILWGKPMIILIMATGIFMTIRTRFFHLRHAGHIFRKTFLSLFKPSIRKSGDKAISPFQSISTALASTMGTGNIVGVASAISLGGAGAVFWMWISAFVGMITKYAENVLAVHFRQKNEKGQYCGGAMYYLKNGLKRHYLLNTLSKPLSVMFALFCLMASFGVGNMVQVNAVSQAFETTFAISPFYTGLMAAITVFIIIVGGVTSIAKTTEKIIPFMCVVYTAACIAVIFSNFSAIPSVIGSIFKDAFSAKPAVGGSMGYIISVGFKRGIFSNEAGLGASTIVHGCADTTEPCEQGMWGIFEVFFDTIVSCTLTAIVILSSGVSLSLSPAVMTTSAFATLFGGFAEVFMAIAISLFAFSTVIGWSFYGIKSLEFLTGGKYIFLYKVIYSVLTVLGATMNLSLVWEISDTLNALMAIPNLIGIICLSGTVSRLTADYVRRKISV